MSDKLAPNVLMVSPDYFDVLYAINPHMLDSEGKVQRVSTVFARQQWANMKRTLENLGARVDVLEGRPGFPDMVFCANQCFPFTTVGGQKAAVMSRMRHPERRGEVEFFRSYLIQKGYKIYETPQDVPYFEGMGDALTVPGRRLIVGGCGPRTDERIYDYMARDFGFEVLKLKLIDPDFYHLDTCLVVLNHETVAFVPSAFEDTQILRRYFNNLIEIEVDEAKKCFAGNAFSLDGHRVILQQGAKKFSRHLLAHGFEIFEIDTREFIKAGGSVFCMKMLLP